MAKKFFIGGSDQFYLLADVLRTMFENHSDVEAITWKEYFGSKPMSDGGQIILDAVTEFDYAVFFLTPDLKLENTNREYAATQNVWFEIGMFVSRHGKNRTLIVVDEDCFENIKMLHYFLTVPLLKCQFPQFVRDCFGGSNKLGHLNSLENRKKKEILKSLDNVKKTIETNIRNKNDNEIYPSFILNEKVECYKRGEEVIKEAKKFVYSIVSYENEYEDPDYPHGLFPYIEEKIHKMRNEGRYTNSALKTFFKRWMNLANNKIADQAKAILTEYADCIEIRDTFCNFIEVLITEEYVLIVLPNHGEHVVIGAGILIKSTTIAVQFANWFKKLVPEPNNFIIDTVEKLEQYRNLTWKMKNSRKSEENSRCNACYANGLSNMPREFVAQLLNLGLLNSHR